MLVIGFSVISSANMGIMKWLAIVSSYGFGMLALALLAVVAFAYTGVGLGQFLANIGLIADYFVHLHRFVTPISDYHEFYLFWWFAWSIMIGQFVARFVGDMKAWHLAAALVVVPSIPIAIWFSVLYYYFSNGLEIGAHWRLAMVVVGVIFVINSLDSLIRLYTINLDATTERFGKLAYILGNWLTLSALVILYQFTPLKIEWIGLIVVAIYTSVYALVYQRRGELSQGRA
jgi:choline-glycine betaine transporter